MLMGKGKGRDYVWLAKYFPVFMEALDGIFDGNQGTFSNDITAGQVCELQQGTKCLYDFNWNMSLNGR